jgi:predicted transposase YbfD/YdcC
MAQDSLIQLLETLRTLHLVDEADLAAFEREESAIATASANDVVATLVERRLLTGFQAGRLLAGQGSECTLADRYVIRQELGAGAMGTVYLAHDRKLDRAVAIKILPPQSVADQDAVARFQREAMAMAKLSHPNIVQAHDADADAGADYVLAVKENQPTLHVGIEQHYEDHVDDDFARTKVRRYETTEQGHGREETRWYYVCPVPENLPDRSRWAHLKAIGIAMSNTQRDGKDCNEVRYYILSKYLSGRRFAEAVRDHWAIENRLHWQLDVTFQEDQCRVRKGHADANLSILRRTALSLLKNESTLKVGIKNKRLTAAWDEAYLEKVLVGT